MLADVFYPQVGLHESTLKGPSQTAFAHASSTAVDKAERVLDATCSAVAEATHNSLVHHVESPNFTSSASEPPVRVFGAVILVRSVLVSPAVLRWGWRAGLSSAVGTTFYGSQRFTHQGSFAQLKGAQGTGLL